jgi:predicted anti-sigma-YlaC factor YlaD
MKKEKITCNEVRKHVCESLGENLNDEKCIDIKQHLDSCAKCRDYFKSVEITIECYRKYNVEVPEEAHDRLMKMLGLNE